MVAESGVVDARRAGPPFAVGVLAVLGAVPLVAVVGPFAAAPRWLAVSVLVAAGVGGVGVAAAVGATLAPDVGLRTVAPERLPGDGVAAYRLPAAAGVGVGVLGLGVDGAAAALGADPVALGRAAGGPGLAVVASVAAGVVAELCLRFGVMTLVVWLAWTVRPALDRGVPPTAAWAGILTAAALGGCVAAAPAAVAGDPAAAGAAAAGAGLGGVAFGSLYRRYDLAAAVVAHAVASLLRAVAVAV
jgi:hypothetical protein